MLVRSELIPVVISRSSPVFRDRKGQRWPWVQACLSISPIFAASCILNNLASAWENQIDANKTVTIRVANFHSGTDVANIIPETATFT